MVSGAPLAATKWLLWLAWLVEAHTWVMASNSGDKPYSWAKTHSGCPCSVPCRCCSPSSMIARSIGSVGRLSLASMAYSSSSCRSGGRVVPPALACQTCSLARNSARAIRFSVSVPVLSVHNTSILPKFSIAFNWRTITPSFAMAREPLAKTILMIAGKSCGVMPTAKATENNNESMAGL